MNAPIKIRDLFLFLSLCIVIGCDQDFDYTNIPIHIIPEPLQIDLKVPQNDEKSSLDIDLKRLHFISADPKLLNQNILNNWVTQAQLRNATQRGLTDVKFELDLNKSKDEHWISINKNNIEIRGGSKEALFQGLQTLRQIFDTHDDRYISIPLAEIFDRPRFPYRGMHLDVCRHFFSVEFIKKYIDLLAYHKFNTFHWHLTEDQGWRIEIKKYPKLAEISAYRNETLVGHYSDEPHQFDNKPYGGFYSQKEIKEIVNYARSRFITIIPEIEMPGHAQAALAAYPELACTEGPFDVLTKWGISENVFCPTETTFQFLEDVIDEVVELFPGPYIHIGGDECPKTAWKASEFCQQLIKENNLVDEHGLQSYFINRMEKYINAKGKKIIGWDEILEGGLAPNATVMSWRGEKGGIEAASENHDVIMTPTSHCYFDYYQSDGEDEPLAIGGYLPLEKVYNYEPIPKELNKEKHKYVLGAQGNVWTEYMKSEKDVEYMTFPRVCAMAEINWSAKERKDYNSFTKRLKTHFKRLDKKKVNYANHLSEVKALVIPKNNENMLSFSTANQNAKIKYWTDQSQEKKIYKGPTPIRDIKQLNFAAFENDKEVSKVKSITFTNHKGTGQRIEFGKPASEKYGSYGAGILLNGIEANESKYGDKEWVGFDEFDAHLKIWLKEKTMITKLETAFFHSPPYWIHAPEKVTVSYSVGPKDLATLPVFDSIPSGVKKIPFTMELDSIETDFIIISVQGLKEIPEGFAGAGKRPWLFVGEIKIY